RPRIPVVGEDHAGRDHDPIGDGDPGGDVDHRVDLDEVADLDAVSDVRLLTDDAIVADRGGGPDRHLGPHPGSISEAHPLPPLLSRCGRVEAGPAGGARAAHAGARGRAAAPPAMGGWAHSPAPQPRERRGGYDASTAATVRGPPRGDTRGVRPPASTSTNAR